MTRTTNPIERRPIYRAPSGYSLPVNMRRLLVVLPLLSACRGPTTPLPSGAERFQPPAVYEQWWDLTEACSGVSGDFAHVAWYRVPNTSTIPFGNGTEVNGEWDEDGNRIVLAGDDLEAGDLVRHEMLHALLRSGGHPRAMFIRRCRSTVVCTQRCITDAGPAPPPDPTAVRVSPTALEVGTEIIPNAPGVHVDDGYFMMIVTARNTARFPVIAQLPPSGDAGPSASFSYRIESRSDEAIYYLRADVPEDSEFAALETKRLIFDLHVGAGNTRYDQPPGMFRFEGAYSTVGTPNAPVVTVSP